VKRVKCVVAALGLALVVLVGGCSKANETGAVSAGAGETGVGETSAGEPTTDALSAPPRSAPTLAATERPSTTDANPERARKAAEKLKRDLAAAQKRVQQAKQKSFFIMPKLVGRNLQDAQDSLQARGSYLLNEVDATGQARVQILDNNWKVCSQKPKAGVRVPKIQVIELKSVKLSESCP
jgi:hypothetical protein